MADESAYEKARTRVEEKLDFFGHLAVYVVVNAFLIFINLKYSPGTLWFYWSLIGWGIGVFFHGMGTFVWGEGSSIREQMIKREMDKH
ncbi:MAG: 2TM domain-containing protein [bacterium]